MLFQPASQILVVALLVSAQFYAVDYNPALRGENDFPQQQNGSAPKGIAACTFKMLTDTEGVDFSFYLRDVYLSVNKNWIANMPRSVLKGQQGTNTFEFQVLQDGSVPKDSLKMVQTSDKSDFDAASLQGIREAVPFHHLPEQFSKPYIVLRFTFYYNLPVPQNQPH
jgi:TonB family protein